MKSLIQLAVHICLCYIFYSHNIMSGMIIAGFWAGFSLFEFIVYLKNIWKKKAEG